jgi:hypothetical protein
MPDQALFDAAASGGLDTNEGVQAQAERMLNDPRAAQSVGTFFANWLDLEKLKRADPKDPATFPTFNADLIPEFRQEADLFVNDVFFNGGGLNALLLGNYTFVNQDLATFYGIPGITGDTFQKAALDGTHRVGFLTQAGFLAGYAKVNETSPVTRGLFIRERLLCDPPNPPPPNVPSLPPPDPNLTTRDRLAQHRADPNCASCHVLMDPLGFGFENFDGMGAWRDTENGGPVEPLRHRRHLHRRERARNEALDERAGARVRGDELVPLRQRPRRGVGRRLRPPGPQHRFQEQRRQLPVTGRGHDAE